MLTLNKGVVGTLFGLSILTATIRTTYRLRAYGRLLFDDFVLLFACVTLTAATGLLYSMIPSIYWSEEIFFNPKSNLTEMIGSEALARTQRYRQLASSFLALSWATIFAVKISFLLFFLQMVDRLKKLMIIWKLVFAITTLSFCFCVCENFIACPHFGLNYSSGKSGPFPQDQPSRDMNS